MVALDIRVGQQESCRFLYGCHKGVSHGYPHTGTGTPFCRPVMDAGLLALLIGEWYVPGNVRLGKLRVFNDDLIQPREGFGMHPHEELEMATIMLAGQLTITDDARERTVVHTGEVHRISASTGTRHTEKNQASDPAQYYQIWIFPDEPGLIPSHEERDFT